ncbi:MAG: hypothetical protein MJH10_19905 [Epibacterium sp.]|nr:hypothetical protein [Epibacterium sp.]NQX75745.1 hypothetical protein [Epibacterium sp.]
MLSKDMHYLVKEFGQTVILRKVTTGGYDPSTGATSSPIETDYSVKSYMAQYTLTEIASGAVIRGDRKALLSSYDLSGTLLPEPEEGDLLIGAGDNVSVVTTQKIFSGDVVICYICQVRE